jgi:phosphoribosylaminoimidazolecarboxamide formyltransferase/IMP cyclohydrolase
MSRVDSTRIAAIKAAARACRSPARSSASDAFFPFRDGLDVVADNGASRSSSRAAACATTK